jgi:glycosyltransferase involved in cell wall biosynthesis
MRIVLDLQACQATNRHRGIGRYSMSLAQAMARQASGHDVRIVLNSRFADTVEPIGAAFEGLVGHENILVFDAPAGVAEIDAQHAWRCRAAERVREIALAQLKPDIVHVASLFEGLVDDSVSSIGHLNPGFGSAVTLYDLIPLLRKESYLSDPRVRNWYYRKLQGLKNADLLLAISEHTRSEAIASLHLPGERIVNISAAVDEVFQARSLSTEESADLRNRYGLRRPFVMYTGGIDARKNIEGLIAAYARLPDALRSAHQLAIICKIEATDRERLQTLAKSAGLPEDAVVFTGFVPDEDLVALYNSCALFVFPSLHEGFGLPALEAMSCGAPVIGANSSSIPEVIGREDALFDPTDVQAIAAKMLQALTDEGFRNSLRQHALEQARKFSWDASARSALQAFEQLHEQQKQAAHRPVAMTACRRPRLAYISPLPPGKSGIADYSAELLPELARYYDIDVIVDQEEITDAWVAANFMPRTVPWFREHADEFDRILYHFGNSSFHQHMFDLLEQHPGIVVLHDFFLSGILNYLEGAFRRPGAFRNALYQSHGYSALLDDSVNGREAAFWKYPCNKAVLDQATGVIVHSEFSRQLARQWYGPGSGHDWQTIPLLRAFPALGNRAEVRELARQRLGIGENEFLICSFGLLGPTKLNDRLLNAWLESPLSRDAHCRLVFVGENDTHAYGKELAAAIARANAQCGNRITITGFAAPATYRDYLAAADVAVQLRSLSRGETSASILDCLAHGIATIINANGSAAELPEQALIKLVDDFRLNDLSDALWRLWKDQELRAALSQRALSYLQTEHHPARVGRMYYDAIEGFSRDGADAAYRELTRALAAMPAPVGPHDDDLVAIAASIARNRPGKQMRQMLVDISELVQRDAKSGIQRVVRNVLSALLEKARAGYRVEPVYDAGGQYVYARNFTCRLLGIQDLVLDDDPIEVHAGDIFLGLDLAPHHVPSNRQVFVDLRNQGVHLYFVAYDLLPILRPDVFVAGAQEGFTRWLDTVTSVADGVVCISRAVADELAEWVGKVQPARHSPLRLGYFHLGADITSDTREAIAAADGKGLPEQIRARPSILMVGTLEPRKGYGQALAAFEALWEKDTDVNFIIVGKQGWLVDELATRLRKHPESGKRLFWFEGASDITLLDLYGTASALLAASEAEGFGLPLIEAAQHRLPIIARDLPVFREVAGEHAHYFDGKDADSLAKAIQDWLKLRAFGKAPSSQGLRWLTWTESTEQLLDAVERQQWYKLLSPPGA